MNGKTPAAGGKGSQAAPWNSLNGVLSGYWATAGWTFPGYTRPLLSTVPYLHIVNGVRVDVADSIGNPPVQPGDAIMLMSGNYGDIVIGAYAAGGRQPQLRDGPGCARSDAGAVDATHSFYNQLGI